MGVWAHPGTVPCPWEMSLPQRRMWDKDIICNAQNKMDAWQPLSVLFQCGSKPGVEPFHVSALELHRVPMQERLVKSTLPGNDTQPTSSRGRWLSFSLTQLRPLGEMFLSLLSQARGRMVRTVS